MKRQLMKQLCEWKDKRNRKPLIIRGARQVGKTWIMKEFGKNYFENTAYVNFDNNLRMKRVFENDFDIERLILSVSAETGVSVKPGKTLLIFDEIQEAPGALGSLKYFYENNPEYVIVAAGSLLGVALHPGTSFPVGKVDFMDLYPLNFREYLDALGETRFTEILDSADHEMITAFKTKYIERLREYYYVGGMPEVVQTYIDTKDFNLVRQLQKNLLDYYRQDFSKHASSALVPRLNLVWDSIPMQLAKENKKYIYGQVREGARAKDFELAIQWLLDCGLIHKVNRVNKPALPLKAYMDMDAFKIYHLDIGLLTAMTDLEARTIIDGNRIFTEFKGALTEQFVLQELISELNVSPYYYTATNSTGEIDFILQGAADIVPLEVKAEENLKARSLRAYCEKYKPRYAVRTSMSDYREQDWMTNIPLYDITEIGKYLTTAQ